MDLKLQNKSALISGSTKGIGFAIAALLAAEGARVIINGRTEAAVKEASNRIRGATPGARVHDFAGDLSAPEPAAELVSRFPAVDMLINNRGIFERKVFEEIDDAEWQRFFDINRLQPALVGHQRCGAARRGRRGARLLLSVMCRPHRVVEQKRRSP
jgi:NAD(P)-dependent dehydrogenase (short-subunit alcohol dehydrogenase family)